jgi:hypothetical protein
MKRTIFYTFIAISCILIITVCIISIYLLFCPFKQKINCDGLSVQVIKNNNKQYILLKSEQEEVLSNPLFPLQMVDVGYLGRRQLAITKYHSFNIFTLNNPIRNTWPIAFSGDDWVIPPDRKIEQMVDLEIVCWNGEKYQGIGSLRINSNSNEIIFIPPVGVQGIQRSQTGVEK